MEGVAELGAEGSFRILDVLRGSWEVFSVRAAFLRSLRRPGLVCLRRNGFTLSIEDEYQGW